MNRKAQGDDRRQQQRYKVKQAAVLVAGRRRLPVRILDINTKGASFILPVIDDIPQAIQLEFKGKDSPVIFTGELIEKMECRANNGVCLIRLGMKFLQVPNDSAAFFSEMSKNIIRNKPAAPETSAPEASSSTEILFAGESEFPTQKQGSSEKTDNRKYNRKKIRLPVICVIDSRQFQAQSVDFSEVGVGFLTTEDFPEHHAGTLHCKASDNLVFKLQVDFRFRGTLRTGDRTYQKVGARIISASPEFQRFIDDNHITQKGTRGFSEAEFQKTQPSRVLETCKYKFIQELGVGGFAKVFLVEDMALHRKVAMKILLPQITEDKAMARQFIKEAQISAKFHHPNIALVFEVGEISADNYASILEFPEEVTREYQNGMVYFTMQYIEGRTLASIIKKQRKLAPLKVLSILTEVGKALDFAHKEGVVHRDIKPENIMMTFDDKILVTDFGIASVLNQNRSSGAVQLEHEQTQNKTKGFMGTPLYVSPEQILEGEIDGRTDLYSLGITGYELLTGLTPFRGQTWMETLAKQLHEEPAPLTEVEPTVPGNFSDFILELLQKKKENRPASAEVFLKKLDQLKTFLLADRVVVEKMEEVSEESFEQVEKLFKQFAKTFKTIGTYPDTHEMVVTAIDRLYALFQGCFESFERLDFEIFSMEVRFLDTQVFSEDQKENGFCFNLFRDGVRNLIFFRGLPLEELRKFLVSVHIYINHTKTYEIDSVTLLFELALEYIDFEYADSFYEDPESQARMYQLKADLLVEEEWSVSEMLKTSFNCEKLISYFQNINQAYLHGMVDRFEGLLKEPDLSKIRKEAIRICLFLAENEQKTEVFDERYRLMEEVIYSCVSENDLSSALFVLKSLESWAMNAPQRDIRECAARFVSLQERLSKAEFIEQLVEKYFNISRSFADGIKAICQALQSDPSVPILFELFKKEKDLWKQTFLAQCCVLAAGSNTEKLNQLAMSLNDELASVFLKGYRLLHENAPNTTLLRWMSFSGAETRLVLVQLASQLNRTENQTILKRCATEKLTIFSESRKLAWQLLDKYTPKALQSVITEFFKVEALKELSDLETNLVFQHAGTTLEKRGGKQFLIQVVQEKGVLGSGSVSIENQKKAAIQLKALNSEDGISVLKKESKRLLGNREYVNFLKQLCEDIP